MNIKKLLLFTLLLRAFSAEIALLAQQPANDGYSTALGAIALGLTTMAGNAATAYSHFETGKQVAANIEIEKNKETDRKQKHNDDTRQATINMNDSILKSLKETQSIYKNDSTPEGKKELAEINRIILHISKFMRDGKHDKEIFEAANYPAEVPKIPSESEIKKPEPKPGKFKRAALFMAGIPIFTANTIAHALRIDSSLAHIAKLPTWKDSLLDTHQKGIGQAAALMIAAGTLGALYKAYTWYTDEDRVLAQETVTDLEAKQKEIAAQFKKEIQKATLSDEEKTKLVKAYENYMDELQEEIDEQKIVAGYGIAKKLAIGAIAAAGGVAGITAFAQYYFNKPTDITKDETNLQPEIQNSSTNKTPTDSVKTEEEKTKESVTPGTITPTTPDSQKPQAYDPTEYNNLTWPERFLTSSSPERQKEINRIIDAHTQHVLAIKQQEKKAQAKKEKEFFDTNGYSSLREGNFYEKHKRHSWENKTQSSTNSAQIETKQPNQSAITADTKIELEQNNTTPATTEKQNPTNPQQEEQKLTPEFLNDFAKQEEKRWRLNDLAVEAIVNKQNPTAPVTESTKESEQSSIKTEGDLGFKSIVGMGIGGAALVGCGVVYGVVSTLYNLIAG